MKSKLLTDLVLHIKTRIPCRGDLSLLLKISQKSSKTSTRFQQYMYLMHLVILHYYNVSWLNIPLWIYGRIWTLWSSSTWGIPSPSYIKSSGSHTTMVQTLFMEGQSPCPMLTTRQHSGSSTTWTTWSYLEGTFGARTLWVTTGLQR
jgi:hypothetical protein